MRAWRLACERAAAIGRPVRPVDDFPNPDPPVSWATFVENGRAALASEFGAERVAARFQVPDDFAAFMQLYGQAWECIAEPSALLFNPTGEMYTDSIAHIIRLRDDGFWTVFGFCADEGGRTLSICCDREHPLFGAVVVGYGHGRPYRDGVPSPKCRVAARSFLDYLQIATGISPPELPVPEVKPEPIPVPSHLQGWVVPLSFEDEYLEATVRCPCGSDRVELHYLGTTFPSREDGSPLPRVVEIDGGYYFIVQAVCADCRTEHVLLDKNRHGCEGFLQSSPGRVAEPPPRPLMPWPCVACGGLVHRVELQIVIDYMDCYFKDKHFLRHGIDRWPDAFGWIDIRILCCNCDRKTGWVSLEMR
jgi:hypothetical protein